MADSVAEHREYASDRRARCAVLTASDSRTLETDTGGDLIVGALEAAGHLVAHRAVVPDEATTIAAQLDQWLGDPAVDVICTTGGTGISSRDTTIEVVRERLDRVLEGFGELFRYLSWEEVGSAAMLSRAVAGLGGETLVFAMPGSPNAVRLAMERLIIPELPHLLWERQR